MAVEFGRYQLLRKIASGGMGEVFLARAAGERGFEKLLVIKRILPHLSEDEEFLAMFLDEARIAARLNHPNIVQIFDLGEQGGSHYLAMEYVPGDDLRRFQHRVRRERQSIPLGVSCRVIADAAAGLDYAHKARDSQGRHLGLVHRDVSPQNILVGFDGAVKLIDFGVAKAAGRLQHTASGVLKGKYAYMSPEQVRGLPVDPRSDVFALGVVFWELLTGLRLFKGDSDRETMRLVEECRVRPPSEVVPGLPALLDSLVLKALAKETAQRYPDAMAFGLALEDFCLSHQLQASSAHLVAFVRERYAGRIAEESQPSNLDELAPDALLESRRTPTLRPEEGAGEEGVRSASEPTWQPPPTSLWRLLAVALSGLAIGAGVASYLLFLAPRPRPLELPQPSPSPEKRAATAPARPSPVSVWLISEPPGATVEIDGQPIGVTPLEYSMDPSAGVKPALFAKEGFEPQKASLSAQAAPELSVQLRRKPRGPRPPVLEIKTGR